MNTEEMQAKLEAKLEQTRLHKTDLQPGDDWVVLHKGRRVMMPSGKDIWRAKNHASCAITNMLDGLIFEIKYRERQPWDYRIGDEVRTAVRKKHFEVITVQEWIERGAP